MALADALAVLARPSSGGTPRANISRIGEPPERDHSVELAEKNEFEQTSALDQLIAAPKPQIEKFPTNDRNQGTPKFQLREGAPASGNTAPSESGTGPGTQPEQPASLPEEANLEAARQRRQNENDYIRSHMEPRENSIVDHITIDKKDHHGLAMEKAALLADIVHDNDFMTPLAMGRLPSRADANGDHLSAKNGQPARANVSLDTPTPILTSLHEIGHHVDDHLTWKKMEPVINAAKASSNIDLIEHLLSPEDIEYYTSPAELWARAYAQYIALRSGDSEAQAELHSVLNNPEFSWKQWDKSDWLPIEDAITNALKINSSK